MGIMITTAKRKKKSQTMIGTDSTRVTIGRFFCYSMIIGRLTEASVAETAAIHPNPFWVRFPAANKYIRICIRALTCKIHSRREVNRLQAVTTYTFTKAEDANLVVSMAFKFAFSSDSTIYSPARSLKLPFDGMQGTD